MWNVLCRNLDQNRLASLPADIFNSSTRLTSMCVVQLLYGPLSCFVLTIVAGGIVHMWHCSNLNNNNLTSLAPDTFDSVTRLWALYVLLWRTSLLSTTLLGVTDGARTVDLVDRHLQNNSYSWLPAGIFEPLTHLATLYVV